MISKIGSRVGLRAPGHDWVIVGGGPHGVCAGGALAAHGASVRIVEPSGQLLHRWADRAKGLGMAWMRSPAGHHLDLQPSGLHHFLHRSENRDVAELAGSLRRPTQAAFLRHSREVIDRHRLGETVVSGRVDSIRNEAGYLRVLGDDLDLRTRRVLIATGSNAPRIPSWARRLRQMGAPVHHLFDGSAPLSHDLVGGGISAVQRALMVRRITKKTVRIWMRRPIRIADFDFERSWTKHRFMSQWAELDEPKRHDFLERHAGRGSVPPGLASRLENAVRQGTIEVKYEVPRVTWDPARSRCILHSSDGHVESTGITLATGLVPESVSGWLQSVSEQLSLPVTRGLPHLEHDMHWGSGVHVCGPLARLRLGPMAQNVVGARWAASKLPGVRMQPV